MNRPLSTYLDALRVVAAALVVLGHTLGWQTLHHDAVIVFFFLSGYLIAYASKEIEKSGFNYIINRVTRIATVVIPAIVLSIAIESYVRPLWPMSHPAFVPLDHIPRTVAVCLSMTSDIWSRHYPCFSNGPYWSVAYEVWYYIFFGIAMFAPSKSLKIIGAVVVAVVMGPKILALIPCWAAGVGVYFLQRRWVPSRNLAIFLAIAAFATYIFLEQYDRYTFVAIHLVTPIELATGYHFWMSNGFLNDWLTSCLLTAHMIGMIAILRTSPAFPAWLSNPVKSAAGVTFSVYLYFSPLRQFAAAVLPDRTYRFGDAGNALIVALIVVIMAIALATITEHQKNRVRKLLAVRFKNHRLAEAKIA